MWPKDEYIKLWTTDSPDKSHKRPPLSLPFYYGWFVISLCFLTTLTSAGVRSSPSVLIHPLEAEFGWSRTLIASAVSMNLLLFGVAAPISGWSDRSLWAAQSHDGQPVATDRRR